MGDYIDRVADTVLERRLRRAGAVVIEGPKGCGKTETARRQAASEVLLDEDDQARLALATDPSLVIDRPRPLLLDEWQVEPQVWNRVRRAVDRAGHPGQFILTGSATPSDDVTRHTGAGRFAYLRMRPMTLFELGQSTGAVSLEALLAGEPGRTTEPELTVSDVAACLVRGGFPGRPGGSTEDAVMFASDYMQQVAEVDVQRVDGVRRDPSGVRRLVRAFARNVGTEASLNTLAADSKRDGEDLDPRTVAAYINALDRLMVVEDQPAWSVHLRSRATLRKAAKRHFVDPCLATGVLRAGTDRLLSELRMFGQLFESMVVRDLRVLSQPLGGEVFHYRDNRGDEVDAVVELPDGRWGAFEVKLGIGQVDEGAASLRSFAEKVDTSRSGKPAVLAVVTTTGLGFRRPDGVQVIPIGALGP